MFNLFKTETVIMSNFFKTLSTQTTVYATLDLNTISNNKGIIK